MIMSSTYLWIALSISILLIPIYILIKGRESDLRDAVVIVLSAGGISAGVRLFVSVISQTPLTTGDSVYIFLAGVCLVWVSIESINDRFH